LLRAARLNESDSTVLASGDWSTRSTALQIDNRPVIAGRRVVSRSDEANECVSPGDERVLHSLPVGSDEDVESAVTAAEASFESGVWANLPPLVRKSILYALAVGIENERDNLALYDTLEMGKPISAALGDASAAAHVFRYFAEFADKAGATVAMAPPGLTQYGRREPRGIVAAIVAWNYPLLNAAMKVAPALAAGNSVILKPSELSSLSVLRLAEIALEAGVPEGVFNVVPGLGRTVGAALARHPKIHFVAFTGSSATGRQLMALAAPTLKPLQLECGGKSANIVCADFKDLGTVARDAAHRIFDNQGQLCVAGARLVAHQSIKDELVSRIVECVKSYRVGDPLDPNTTHGPVASRGRMEAILESCEEGVRTGARLCHGAVRRQVLEKGFYVEPTIFDNVVPNMPLAQKDIFGPLLSVMAFESIDEAIAISNSTSFGLSSYVWTCDLSTASEMIRRLKVGRVTVFGHAPNPNVIAFPLSAEPFGQSGFGPEAGLEGWEVFTRLKAVEIHA